MKRRTFLRGVGALAGGLAARPGAVRAEGQAQAGPPLPAPTDPDLWPAVRRQFQLPADLAYLNTAGLGASPRAVTNTLVEWTDREEANPAAGHNEADWTRIRTACARVLGPSCGEDEVAFVSTATEGINAILNTIPLSRGDEIITSTHEHASLVIALLHRVNTLGVAVRTFEPDLAQARGNVDRVAALVTPRTKLIFVSHVTTTTGQIMPAAGIAAIAEARGIAFALDGAQSFAHIPFDISATGAHYYTASCHKFLLAPKRTGLLYVRKDRLATAVPAVVGTYSDLASSLPDRTLTLRPGAQRFEYGTQNDALIYGIESAIAFLSAIGMPVIWARNQAMAERTVEGLRRIAGVTLLSPSEATARSAIITFTLPGRDNRQVASDLMRRRLRVRSVTEGGLDAVRVSYHVYNNEAEVDRLLAGVAEIARAPRGSHA